MLEFRPTCHITDQEPRPCTSQFLAFSGIFHVFRTIYRLDGHPDSALYRKGRSLVV